MPRLVPVSRRVLIERLTALDWAGPFSAANHHFMTKGKRKLRIPNPHEGDIGVDLLAAILKQAGVTRDEWFSV